MEEDKNYDNRVQVKDTKLRGWEVEKMRTSPSPHPSPVEGEGTRTFPPEFTLRNSKGGSFFP